MNSWRVLESRRVKAFFALLALTVLVHSAQAQGLVEGAGITGAMGGASQGASGMGGALGNMFGRAGDALGTPAQNAPQPPAAAAGQTPQSAPAPNAMAAAAPPSTALVYPLAGLARRDAELIIAAYKGDTPGVRRALARGANVNVRDRVYTWTPLMWASQNGHLGAVRYLLQKGANVNARSNDPNRRILIAYPRNLPGIDFAPDSLNGFDISNGGVTALMIATTGGYALTMRELLAHGADVNARTVQNSTALMAAAGSGYLPSVQLLIKHRANVHQADYMGMTPLVFAAIAGHQRLVQTLLTSGAKADIRLFTGQRLSDAVRIGGKREIANLLDRAAARQKRVARRSGGDKSSSGDRPVRHDSAPSAGDVSFPKAKDARPFDDGVMILR